MLRPAHRVAASAPLSASLARLTSVRRHLSTSPSRMAPTPIAVVAGVGVGTGGAVAQLFAKKYPVLLLSRSQSSIDPVLAAITAAGGKALGVPTDAGDPESVAAAFAAAGKLAESGDGVSVAAAVFNVSSKFVRKPFLDLVPADMQSGLDGSVMAGFHFAQAALPLLLKHAGADPALPPTLIFTGATASVKGSANFASFAASKFAIRAMSQSLAREFGPKGVHVAHAVIDGVIKMPRTDAYNVPGEDGRILPEDIAESYWALHAQKRSGWTWEVDLRPWGEKW